MAVSRKLVGALVAAGIVSSLPSPLARPAGSIGPPTLIAQTSVTGAAMGTVADLTWGITRADMDRTIAAMRDAGITWVRANQNWAAAEPDTKGVLNNGWLADIDYAVSQARASGIQVLMPIADGVPYWASADPSKYVDATGVRRWNKLWRPSNPADYAAFATAMVNRYKPLGVRAYEVWNEPNTSYFWPSGPNAAEYTALLSSAYPAIKAADPAATVVVGGLSKNDYTYVEALYAAGAKPYFDAVALHPYTGAVDPTWCWNQTGTTKLSKDAFCGIEEVRRSMVANADSAKSIWLTEFGWSTTTGTYGVSEAVQADFLNKAMTRVRSNYSYVATAFWYNFRNTGYLYDNPLDIEANWGLMRTDFAPKPALATVKALAGAARTLPPPSISINNVTVVEGGSGTTTNAGFTLSLSAAAAQATTVTAVTANGTATAGSDYTALASTTVTFAAGETKKTLNVPVLGDTRAEGNETFLVNLSAPVGAVLGDAQGQATILDEEGIPTVLITNPTVVEGRAGVTTNATFTISLSSAAAQTVTVKAATANGTATAGPDYTAVASTTITFAPGETAKTLAVPVIGDSAPEGDETFVVDLSSPVGALLADAQGVATIVDDEDAPAISVSDVNIVEGAGTGTFKLTLSAPATQTVTVKASTANGTATAGSDYTALPGATVSFLPGETTKTLGVSVLDDTAVEGNETFVVNLSTPTGGAVLADAQGLATILDDEGAPNLSISDASAVEGATGTTATAAFKVSLSSAATQPITVTAATANDTAKAGSDYTAVSTTLTFAPGDISKTLNVSIVGDSSAEGNETLFVNLSSPVNAVLADNQGLGTIVDDDGLLPGTAPGPTLSVNNTTVVEGAPGTASLATFTVTLSAPAPLLVTVKAATANGTATAGADFTALPLTSLVTFLLGETSKTITVPVLGDSVAESNENFFVNLSAPVGATLADAQGVATIIDPSAQPVTLSVNDITVAEGAAGATTTGTFTVSLSGPSAQTVTVKAATANGSATAGSDYTAVGLTTLTFNPGVTTKTLSVSVLGDGSSEGNETFVVNLSSPVGAALADAQGLAAILDDEGAPTVWISDPSVIEGSGSSVATFRVSLSGPSTQPVSFTAATANGTAPAGSTYTPLAPTTFSFAPGETTKTVNVPVAGDSLAEGDRTFMVNLSSPVGAVLADTQGLATILDDEGPPAISINDLSVVEGPTGTTATAAFTVSLSTPAALPVNVTAVTANGTATAGADYSALAVTTVRFAPGETSKTLAVTVNGDGATEGDETFVVNLSQPVAATLADDQGVATIVDSAAVIPAPVVPPTLSASPSTVNPGGSVTATWSNIASPSSTDSIGLYPSPSSPDSARVAWVYTGGGASGTRTLSVPASTTPGTTYELRLFSNDSYSRLTQSGPFTVSAPAVSSSQSSIIAGGSLPVSWSGIPNPSTSDWVGLFSSPSSLDTARLAWIYTGGASTGSWTLTVPADATPGTTYELRLFTNGGTSRAATWGPLTVFVPTVSASPATINAGGSLAVNWSGIANPSPSDWVGLFKSPSDPDTARLAWIYTGGTSTGGWTLTVPVGTPPGTTYELRLFSNAGTSRAATWGPLTVT